MVYGRWCPKRVRGTGQAGQTSPAGWARQGRSRGSICVYRTTRVWDRRCSDTSAIIALRLAPIRPSRQHYAHLLVRFTPPPLTRRRPPYLLRLPTARAASGRARCNGPPAWEQEPRGGAEPRRQRGLRHAYSPAVPGTLAPPSRAPSSPLLQPPPAMLCQCTGICTPHAAPRASAQFADEAPPRPSVRSCLAPPASMPPTRPPALPPNHGDAAYLGEPAPQILTPMLPAVPVCPPTSPSSLVQWANLLLPLRTRLPSLCSLMSRGRRVYFMYNDDPLRKLGYLNIFS